MNGLALAASILSTIAVLGVGVFGEITRRRTGRVSELDTQYGWALKRIEMIEKDNEDLKKRATNAEERANNFERQLLRCQEHHNAALVQIGLLERLLDERTN